MKEKPLENCEYNMTYAEIGKELGISRETVRQIQARALRKIAHKLKGYEGYEQDGGESGLAIKRTDMCRGDSW
jgi:predicted DNA-binding protein (UPF0251 family)